MASNNFKNIVSNTTPIWQHQNQPQQHSSLMEQNIPTVVPVAIFDARADADSLHKAMKGLGTDEKALMAVLCHRSGAQRVLIAQAYKCGYGKDLESKLKSELSRNFERVMVSLCLSTSEFLSREMYEAMAGLGTNDITLIDILCSSTNQQIREINFCYLRDYGHSLEKDIVGDTSGTFKMVCVSLCQGQRDENHSFLEEDKVRSDVHRLYEAGEARLGTDESLFCSILSTRSWTHLQRVMVEYQLMYGNSLEKAIKSEFSGNAEKILLGIDDIALSTLIPLFSNNSHPFSIFTTFHALHSIATSVQCAQNRLGYFAQRLRDSMKGLGTDDRSLIRNIVSHCDVDLGNIKQEYEKKFCRSLQSDILDDTSGEYRCALLALIGCKNYLQ